MIQTVLRREYLVSCDGCGQSAPAKDTADQAYEWVVTQGWQTVKSHCGFAILTTWLCPACQAHREAV